MTKGLPWGRASRRSVRRSVAGIKVAFLSVVVLVVLGAGSAQAAKRRVGISLNGPHASAVHEVVAGVLRHHGFEATSTDLSGDSDQAIAEAARQGKLAAVIVGEVRDGGKRLKLRVHGSSGDLIGEGSWSEAAGIKKLETVLERTLWARVGGSLSKARPGGGGASEKTEKAEKSEAEETAPSAEPEKAPTYSRSKESEAPAAASASSEEAEGPRKHKKKKKTAAEEEPEAPTGSAGTALELAVGPRFIWRDLTWSPQVPALRGYTVGHAPSIGALLAWYPAAHFRGGWPSNIGVAASVEYTPGLVSETSDGSRYPTSESDYWAGARGRLIFGVAEASLTLGGGQQSFIFHSNGAGTPRSNLSDLPDVQYTYARAGVDLRIALPANVSLRLGGGYRYVVSAGDTNYLIQAPSYFPNSKFTAFDVMAGAGWRFLPVLEARAGIDLRRYAMNAGTNTYNVIAATDQYFAVWAQVALVLDGYAAAEGGPPASGKAAPPAPAEKSEDENE
jgi:hypothetical protein